MSNFQSNQKARKPQTEWRMITTAINTEITEMLDITDKDFKTAIIK